MSWLLRRSSTPQSPLNVLRHLQQQAHVTNLRATTPTSSSTTGSSCRTPLRNHLHTFLHRRNHLHTTTSARRLPSHSSHLVGRLIAKDSQQQVRGLSYSFIPRLVLRSATRLPVFIAGGSVAGGAYVLTKVEEARNNVYDKIDYIQGALGTFANGVTDALGKTGKGIGEAAEEAKDFGSGIWSSFRGFVDGLLDASQDNAGGGSGSKDNAGNASPPPNPTPERIAAAAALASTLPMVLDRDEGGSDADAAANDLMILTKKLIEIRSILLSIDQKESLQLPAIVVVGSQSSGKSSVLEAVVGREFLPKGNNMVTRRPIELTLIHTPPTPSNPHPQTFAEFPSFAPGQHITDFSMVQRTLLDLNLSIPADQAVSSVPIELRIHSPNVPDLSLVDLPGYIELSSMDQPDTLKEEIANLCEKYIKPPNIILAVCAADVDLANSPALRASRRVDPLGMRTIGVVTKMDLVEPKQGADILTNKRYPLALGYVGVVCKAAAKSREGGRSLIRVRDPEDEGLAVPVRKQEQAYFGAHKEEFSREGVQVTTDLLKKRLMHVLEESMANSLHTISNNVALELEEARYQFKVQYNDRTVSPESYLAETLDILKQRLNAFSKGYSKQQVRNLLKNHLDNRTMDILAQIYWQDASETGNMEELATLPSKVSEQKARAKANTTPDGTPKQTPPDLEAIWRHKLEAAASALTKSGVGRSSTQLVVEAIRAHITNTLTNEEPLINHPDTAERINAFSDAILRDRYAITADQVENCIKPYKYEIELDGDGKEWDKGRQASLELLQKEIDMCENALNSIRESVGGNRRLKNAMQYVSDLEEREKKRNLAIRAAAAKRLAAADDGSNNSSSSNSDDLVQEDLQDPSRPMFNPTLLVKAREAHFLSGRTALLKARMAALKSKQCRNYSDKNSESIRMYCPEVFLNVVADKLASTAVMFINIELLAEYFYLFPREIETRLGYDLSRSEILEFARENPRFRKHLDLQERKEKLELVTGKLDALLKLQQERQGGMRHTSTPSSMRGSGGSRRFGLF